MSKNVLVTIIILFLAFFLFWYVPYIHKDHTYREAGHLRFSAAEECYKKEFNSNDYAAASHCFDDWEAWMIHNDPPEPGIDWPWADWHEK